MEATLGTTKKLTKRSYMNVVYLIAKLSFTMLTCCELFYFSAFLTDSALFGAAMAALILSVTGTIDFAISFFLGVIIEVVHLPWGKYRSWLLICPPIVLVTHIMMFTKIGTSETAAALLIGVGFIVSHIFWSVGESAVNAMPLAMTDDLDERAGLSLMGGRGSMGNTLVFGIIAVPIITLVNNMFGNNLYGYCVLGAVLCVIYWIGFWWLFFTTKGCETTARDAQPKQRSTLLPAIKSSFSNPHLLTTMFATACTYCYMILQSTTMYYFFTYTLGGGSVMGIMGTFVTLVSVARLGGSVLVPLYLKLFKGSKRAVFRLGFIGFAVFCSLAFVLNLPPIPTLILLLLGNCIGGASLAMQLGLYMDCAVYSEYKAGKDVKGFVMALTVMPVKLGITIKNYIVSFALIYIGYSATAADTAAYAGSFNTIFLMLPAIICVLCVVVHIFGYRLDEKKVVEMQNEIKARKAAVS